LLDAGAHLVGKTHTDELTWSLTGENAHYGAPVNVSAPGRITGGSSSGSASAVAAGVVDFAVGSDTGGSVRLPASFCGSSACDLHTGASPRRRVSRCASFDTCGWFAGDAGSSSAGAPCWRRSPRRAFRRLLIAQDALKSPEKTVAHALRSVLDKVAALVGMPEHVTVGGEPLTRWMDYFRFLQGAEAWACHGEWITREKPVLGPGVKERFAWAATVGPEDITRARTRREEITRAWGNAWGRTVLALPFAPASPCPNQRQTLTTERLSTAYPCIAGLARLPHSAAGSSTVARSLPLSPHAATTRSSNWLAS
jgi:amidase